jgi:exopolyphosphatase/guanosine-5'-triphosphate,3'-diphosphate pyrophosphatase
MLLAGIDIGTLTCRLLIGEATSDRGLIERYSDRRILGLGEGVDRTKRLSTAGIERVCQVLCEWRTVIEAARVDGELAVATSAVRDAENRDALLARIKETAGFAVETISGEEEARRTLLGLRAGLPRDVTAILGLDIGGGSMEFILDHPPAAPVVRSIDVGVVRLTERVFLHDPPAGDEILAARTFVAAEVTKAQESLGPIGDVTLVGTAGTITTLAAMAQHLPAYEPARIHNYRLSLETIGDLEAAILGSTSVQRREMAGLETGREVVIAAGVVILRAVMTTLGFMHCLVSDYGLREGVLIDLAQRMRRS